ncbi:MAG TPA: Gfo/Idh/MocA family oxidoreductase [Gemmataceae bacterium]|nr:Gfo/Idh/MocA family oxidoreductase [Gemmataceae bacterium]
MMIEPSNRPNSATRRDFLKTTAAAAGAIVATQGSLPAVYAAGSDPIKVGLIGCGNRGRGAAENVLSAAPGVQIVALGDTFAEPLKEARERLGKFTQRKEIKQRGNSADLPESRCFVGLDAYEKVIGCPEVNYVILTTPPGFRPIHLQAAVAAGKNIFAEKPVAVDGTGIRKVLAAYEEARKKNLAVGVGTQRRHQRAYLEVLKRIQDGAIGELVGGRCYWNQNTNTKRRAEPGETNLAYQIRNWYGFPWLSGDHIVEQHVHNLDVLNWALGAHPVAAVGMGYRVPRDPGYGPIYNFFAVDLEYPNGVHALSMCRQISSCANEIGEYLVGSKGSSHTNSAGKLIFQINGKKIYTDKEVRKQANPYVQEHTDLIESIRSGKPYNELKQVAESTLTAIMGRMSAYTGKRVSWEQALNTREDLVPKELTWDTHVPVPPVATPGKTPLL